MAGIEKLTVLLKVENLAAIDSASVQARLLRGRRVTRSEFINALIEASDLNSLAKSLADTSEVVT